LPPYNVFIAYGGKHGEAVARFVAECLRNNGMRPRIALPGAIGEIPLDRQEEIFEIEGRCDAIVAVYTKGTHRSVKFIGEVERALYRFRIPVVAFVQKRSRVLHILNSGATKVGFGQRQYRRKCDELVCRVRRSIFYSRTASHLPIGQRLPRRVFYG